MKLPKIKALTKELENLKQITIGLTELDSGQRISHANAKIRVISLKKKWSQVKKID